MKNIKTTSVAALVLAAISAAHAQSTIAGWDFDGTAEAAGYNTPSATSGSGAATQLGMNNSYTYANGEGPGSSASCDVTSAAGASTGSGSYGWRVRGNGNTANSGAGVANGWNSAAPIGTQGAQFLVSTLGYNDISLTFDLDTTAQAEANLEVLYTLNGTTWNNATIASAGSGINGGVIGTIKTGNATDLNTVDGSYVTLASGWNNQISVNFDAISGANNDANFGVEIVNASTGADDVAVSGAALNNSSGNWRYDNVIVSGVQAVPESGTCALGGLGLGVLAMIRRFRKA